MTIRYTCSDCGSVLKIKDEKAGTNAKCPKCKAAFVVPMPADQDDGIEVEEPTPAPVDEPVDMVDMPIELTPEVQESGDFDPMDVLNSTAGPSAPRRSTEPASVSMPPARKPSMAELMKDLETTKKKNRKSSPEVSRPTAASSLQSAGSAADMLSRAYQQKRDTASAPVLSQKDAKAAEEKALLVEFIRTKALPTLIGLAVFLVGYYWWMSRPTQVGPPLYTTTGIVRKSGSPMPAARVYFEPVLAPSTDPQNTNQRGAYSGVTDSEGRFSLIYTADLSGAAEGEYQVSVTDQNGVPIPLPQELNFTVTPDGPNDFEINL